MAYDPTIHSERLLLTFLERAVAGYELTATGWTFLHVATRDMKLAF